MGSICRFCHFHLLFRHYCMGDELQRVCPQSIMGGRHGRILFGEYLQASDAGQIGSLVPGVLIPLIIVWVITLGVLFRGVQRGIEIANRIFIPTLVVIFLIICIRAVTLPGAALGLQAFFSRISALLHPVRFG